jgi:hypothetical protein
MNLALVFGSLLLSYAPPSVAGDNTVGGTGAGADISTGTDNTILGTQAGESITSGGYNVIIGEDGNITTGSSNILIGNSLSQTVAGTSKQLDIGDTLYGGLEATSGGTALNIGTATDTGVTLSVLGLGSMIVPSGTTAERPSSTANGQIRYNSTLNVFEAYANSTWGTIASGSSPVGQVFSSGQLAGLLPGDTTNTIDYCPYKGNLKTTATYGTYTIPSGCLWGYLTVSGIYIGGVAGQTAAANTLYYVYLINVSGTTYLDLETTGHATDSTTGIEIESGDNTKTLVGMIHTDANSEVNSETSNTVATWDNREQTACYASFSANRTTSMTTPTLLNSENTCGFMVWKGDPFTFVSAQQVSDSTAGDTVTTNIYLDSGTTTLVAAGQTQQYSANVENLALATVTYVPTSEGYHYTTVYGYVGTGTGTWYADEYQNVLTMQ